MFEESNPIQEENVFSDVTAEEESLFDDVEETAEPSEEKATEEAPQWSLRVKYNGEEKDLNEEDARTYAQKGMNYDRIYEPLERLARMNNLSVGDYLNQLNDTQFQYEVSREVDRLKEDSRYEGINDEILEELASSRVHENFSNLDRRFQEDQRAQEDAIQQRAQRDVERFLNEYPEFRNKGTDAIDPKVFEYVNQGYSLLEAYNKFSRESEVAKASKQNEENRRRSLGNTTNAGKQENDDFLNGFLNG